MVILYPGPPKVVTIGRGNGDGPGLVKHVFHQVFVYSVGFGKISDVDCQLHLDPGLSANDLVFSHYDGSPLLPNSVTHAWIKLVRRCGLNGIRLHDARHTHASLLLKQGVHPKIVQERLGHGSIQITLDTYSHVAPGLQQAAANKFDDIMLSKV